MAGGKKRMNRAQASRAWEIPESEVKKICREMGIDVNNIPDGTVPVYMPSRLYDDNLYRYYIYLLEVISNTHMEIQGIDRDILETCVAQLKEKKLIVLKKGADPASLDYHDYVMSAETALFGEWYGAIVKSSMTLFEKFLSLFKK